MPVPAPGQAPPDVVAPARTAQAIAALCGLADPPSVVPIPGGAASYAHVGGRFAVVRFADGGRRLAAPPPQVRLVVASFVDVSSAEMFAVEHGWHRFAVAPAAIAVPSRP